NCFIISGRGQRPHDDSYAVDMLGMGLDRPWAPETSTPLEVSEQVNAIIERFIAISVPHLTVTA
ncbi:hypothetical protein, partial [Candidatus Entotheonella palauensis]|uniref:hypothetical protein n=1 Tax=Candidatus Entotheonella palauensis TaxID=93172 RepID=UPI001C4E258A